MEQSLSAEIERLRKMPTGELRERYAAVFGEPTKSYNREHLFKKITYRLQERAHGTLSERAKARAAELLDEGAIRASAPRRPGPVEASARDPRLPAVGAVLKREYRGTTYKVIVGEDGFEFDGQQYRSLSAIAKKITGTAWNGFLFFKRTKPEAA